VEVVPAAKVLRAPEFYDWMSHECEERLELCCVSYRPYGFVVAVRAGDGIQTVVACVEVGENSNAHAFAEACNKAARNPPSESPALTAAYDAWLLDRLRRTGTMTGGGPGPTNMHMSEAALFIKSVGPLPTQLSVEKTREGLFASTYKLAEGLEICGGAFKGDVVRPSNGPLVTQLSAGDRVIAINNVPVEGKLNKEWFDRVVAACNAMPADQPRYMQVESTMPYFQPNHLITVGLPPGSGLGQLGLAGGPAKPPKLESLTPLAQSLGCQPKDVVVQVVLDGATRDATCMTTDELIAAANGATTVQLTLLQPSLTTDNNHKVTWPLGVPTTVL